MSDTDIDWEKAYITLAYKIYQEFQLVAIQKKTHAKALITIYRSLPENIILQIQNMKKISPPQY